MVDFICEFLENRIRDNEKEFLKEQLILSMYGDMVKEIGKVGESIEKGKEG